MTTQSTLPASVDFCGHTLSIIDHHGQPWLTARDVAAAIGYAQERAIHRLYEQHAAEFSADMCSVIDSMTEQNGGSLKRSMRIFSPRGAHLIAMFARTTRAAEFRHWVLDVLEGIVRRAAPVAPVVISLPGEGRYFVVVDSATATNPHPVFVRDAADYSLVRADHVRAIRRDLATLGSACASMRSRLRVLEGEANPREIEQPLQIALEPSTRYHRGPHDG